MLLTKPQQLRFWREWSVACKVQGWTAVQSWTNAQIDNERHALLERAGFESLTKVDHMSGFDRVLAELTALSRPADINPQLDAQNQPRKRLIYAIKTLAKQFSMSVLSDGRSAYVAAITLDRWGTTDLDKLSLPQLEQLRNTLAARASAHRAKERNLQTADTTSANAPF